MSAMPRLTTMLQLSAVTTRDHYRLLGFTNVCTPNQLLANTYPLPERLVVSLRYSMDLRQR
jgi:hypothetical protein